MDVGTLIGEALRSAGCSRAELARRAGIPRSVLSAYEHGHRDPTVGSLQRVLAAAGLEVGVRPLLRRVDAVAADRELQDVLSFVDALPFTPRREPLGYPPLSTLVAARR